MNVHAMVDPESGFCTKEAIEHVRNKIQGNKGEKRAWSDETQIRIGSRCNTEKGIIKLRTLRYYSQDR